MSDSKQAEPSDSYDNDTMVNLISSDGDQFEVQLKVAAQSELCKSMCPSPFSFFLFPVLLNSIRSFLFLLLLFFFFFFFFFLFAAMLNDSGDGDDEDEEEQSFQEIPLPNVNSAVLAKVIEFCKYHAANGQMADIEKPLKSANMAENVSA